MNPIHRYDLHGPDRLNWATVILTSDGIFTAVSDYGEFGYVWRATGREDFREFFFDKGPGHWYYFAEKFSGGRREYDQDSTGKRLHIMRIPIMVERFCKEILPKLEKAIRAEMAAESMTDREDE